MDNPYIERFKERLAAQDPDGASEAVKAAFADPKMGEDELAWLAGASYESGLNKAFGVLPQFVKRFPNSLHMIRAYFANLLERMGEVDAATEEARLYLCAVRKTKAWEELDKTSLIQEGVAGCVGVMTAAYRRVGARSHCLRILEWGGRLTLGEEKKKALAAEAEAIRKEIGAADQDWEKFFAGKGPLSPDLFDTAQKACPALAKRLELIEGNFRFQPDYKLGDEEHLQLVYRNDDGSFLLA